MKKQIMSIAAAAALFTTGAMAFDTTNGTVKVSTAGATAAIVPQGTIITEDATGKEVASSYTSSTGVAAGDLTLSATQRGDALIYPAFNQTSGWGTEIVVRNTSLNAVVAKAVVYASDDSRELVDFNIYLSAKDVCRFTIKDGKITSSDGSIRTFGILPHQVNLASTSRDLTDYALIKFADEVALSIPMTTEAGYVAIYGMEQSSDFNGFHTATRDHKDLYAAYAASLDADRGQAWRQLTNTNGAMVHGMFVEGVTESPNVALASAGVVITELESNGTLITTPVDFTDVEPVLTGSVRIANDAGRDVLLPALALENFTDNNRMLWTEGEYASIADRRIDAAGLYAVADIEADAVSAFPATTAIYTYANASGATDNSLLITQPYKRTLAQLDVAGAVANGYTVGATDETTTKLATGTKFAFQVALSPFDEDENGFQAAPDEIGGTIITSPRTSDDSIVTPDSFNNELQEIKPSDLEKSAGYGGKFDNLDGIVEVTLPVASIVTQMSASKAGTSDEINWVYSDTTN